MTQRNKLLITILCLTVILCTIISGTIAWLISQSGPITNTFIPSNVKVELTEGTFEGKMVPGATISKAATVKVTNDIDCYVFIEVDAAIGDFTFKDADGNDMTATVTDFLTYAMADGWIELDATNHPGVYYRVVTKDANPKSWNVLAGDAVTVKDTVSKPMMEALTAAGTAKYPTLTFTASAIQLDNLPYGDATTEAAKALVAWTTLNTPNP